MNHKRRISHGNVAALIQEGNELEQSGALNELKNIANDTFHELLAIAKHRDEDRGKDKYDWTFVKEVDDISVYRKSNVESSGFASFKSLGMIEATPEYVFSLLSDLNRVKTWEPLFGEVKTLKKTTNMSIIYKLFRGVFPVASRDFCALFASRKEEDGTYVVAIRSVDDPGLPDPLSGTIRGEILTSGFVISPIKVHGYARLGSMVTYVIQVNPKGWLPPFVVNKISQYQPVIRMRSAIPESEQIDQAPDLEILTPRIIPTLERTSTSPTSSSTPSPRSQTSTDSDSESDNDFRDPENDFSSLSLVTSPQLHQSLSILNKQIENLQQVVEKMDQTVQGLVNSQHQPKMEDVWNNRIRSITRKIALIQQLGGPAYQLSCLSKAARLALVFLVFVWPILSYRIWRFAKTNGTFIQVRHILLAFLKSRMLGWVALLT